MRKLISGIVEFRRNVRAGYQEAFSKLALTQMPDALFISCSDSRVVPNTFASTNPGDLFVLRNVGNLVPECDENGVSFSDESEAAAIEFSVLNLKVNDIIVCGHSECGAMHALLNNREKMPHLNLKKWLRHGDESLAIFNEGLTLDPNISAVNQLSQINVITQMKHVATYPIVKERILNGTLRVHGWWFDITHADVYSFDEEKNKFVIIDETEAERLYTIFKN